MRIALATCSELFEGEADDAPLKAALEELGVQIVTPAWDDSSIDWAEFDACLLRTTWDYHQRRSEFLAWAGRVAEESRLYNPLPVVEWSSVKTYLRDLARAGLPVAPTLWLERGSEVDLEALVKDRGWNRGFLKPDVGASAYQTLPFTIDQAGIAMAQAHLDTGLAERGFLLQPFLESVGEEGEYSVIFIDGEVTHAVRKVPIPGEYRVMDHFGATDCLVTMAPETIELARRVCATFEGLLGLDSPLLYARVDLLRDDTGSPVINEVELVEPSLFFRHCEAAAVRLAQRLVDRIAGQR